MANKWEKWNIIWVPKPLFNSINLNVDMKTSVLFKLSWQKKIHFPLILLYSFTNNLFLVAKSLIYFGHL